MIINVQCDHLVTLERYQPSTQILATLTAAYLMWQLQLPKLFFFSGNFFVGKEGYKTSQKKKSPLVRSRLVGGLWRSVSWMVVQDFTPCRSPTFTEPLVPMSETPLIGRPIFILSVIRSLNHHCRFHLAIFNYPESFLSSGCHLDTNWNIACDVSTDYHTKIYWQPNVTSEFLKLSGY